ncbi:SPFH domain-containing protein [Patescibacteria group bacterium]|nr:SPFH domain-containing protein [Patescibacteria group bacterium]
MIVLIVLLFIIFLAGLWFILSWKIVGPDEMAVKVMFGKPKSFCESGFRFIPFLPGLKCYLRRYSQKTYSLDYAKQAVITAAGRVAEDPDGVKYGAQRLMVDAAVYLNFPREPVAGLDEGVHPLIKILRAKVPVDEEALKDWTEEAVTSALRSAFGQITWYEAINNDKGGISKKALEFFKKYDGALIKAGFRDPGIGLVITEIRLPKDMEEALMGPDKARLEADAAESVAKSKSIKTIGVLVEMIAQATGKTSEQVREDIKNNPNSEELFNKLLDIITRQMAIDGGSFFDLRYKGPDGIGSLLSAIATWQRMPRGENTQRNTGGSGGAALPRKKKKNILEMSEDEFNDFLEEKD